MRRYVLARVDGSPSSRYTLAQRMRPVYAASDAAVKGAQVQGDTPGVPAGWITTAQACEILGVKQNHLYMMCLRGYLSFFKVGGPRHGGMRLYREAEVRAYKASHPALGAGRRLETAS